MNNLNNDLKAGDFKQFYLFYGEESYLKRLFRDKFIKALIPSGDTMNITFFEGKSIDINSAISQAATLPFFSQRRLIIFENSGFLKSGENALLDHINDIPESTYFIFVEDEVDKRSKMYKMIKSKGSITEFSYQNEDILRKWVFSLIKEKDKDMQVDTPTVDYFVHRVGIDMENISNELEKLLSYTRNKGKITKADIEEVCVSQISNRIFDMINAVAAKDQKRALELYYDLLSLKEPPMRILYLMTRQYRIMYQVKDLSSRGLERAEIAGKTGLNFYVVGKYISKVSNFTNANLRSIIDYSAELEEGVKSGKIQDVLAVEVFIVKNSSLT